MTQSWITSAVLLVLLLLSVLTWTIGILNMKSFRRALLQDGKYLNSIQEKSILMEDPAQSVNADFAVLQKDVLEALQKRESVSGNTEKLVALMERKLSQKMNQIMKGYERGYSELATIASSAPFIGLFGTVWGIMDALRNIGMSGHVTMDAIAGPVGEALITTAIGIATALPAVYFHNYMARQLQLRLARLESFSTDLINALAEDA